MGLLLLALFTAGFSMIASRLSSSMLTAPMVFIALGMVLFQTGVMAPIEAERALHVVAEITLIILLFLDAAQIKLQALRMRHVWPARMLAAGLPLSIVLGTAFVWYFMPQWPLIAAALCAAILAPTDAALGQAVVSNPLVPERSRRALTVESGLNDGMALPAVLLFASLTAETMAQGDVNWIVFGAKQLLLGPLSGYAVGLLGGLLFVQAHERKLTSRTYEGIGAISLAGAAYLGADLIGGNGFIAAFVAGLLFGNTVKGRCQFVYEFLDSDGQLLTWGAFFLLGLALIPQAIHHLSWSVLIIILSSLFVVRPLAIYLSLIGTDASATTRLFFGWFGPRGLATALFALLTVPIVGGELADEVLYLAANAVWISALLHGLTAAPGARWYAKRLTSKGLS